MGNELDAEQLAKKDFSPKHEKNICKTWGYLKKSLDVVGRDISVTFSGDLPETRALMEKFAIAYSLETDAVIQKHGQQMILVFDKIILNLESRKAVVPVLKKVAETHIKYAIPPNMYESLKNSVITVLQEKLGLGMSPEVTQSFKNGLDIALGVIRESGIHKQLTQRDIQIIMWIWSQIRKDSSKNGIALFQIFFTNYPRHRFYFKLYKHLTVKEMVATPQLTTHATRVILSLSNMLNNLDKPEVMIGLIKTIATNHKPRNITNNMYEDLRESFLKMLLQQLGAAQVTDSVLAAFTKVLSDIFKVITDINAL